MTSSVGPVGSLPSDYFQTPATSNSSSGEMDKTTFLKLLVASLKYQDPSEPMSTSDLMQQTTQLATMEQLTTMTELSQQSFILQTQTSAMTMVGKTVEYASGDTMLTGRVTAVDFSATPPLVEIDGKDTVTFGAIRSVVAAAPVDPAGTTPATTTPATTTPATTATPDTAPPSDPIPAATS